MTANNATIKSSSALSPGDEAPDLTTLDLSRGWFERGGKRIGKAAEKAAFRAHLGKRQVNMYLDAAVIEYFKAKAGGRGYQTLINEALRESIERESIALRDYYTARTEAVALDFAEELIQQVIAEITELGNRVAECTKIITKGTKAFDDAVAARCKREEKVNFRRKLVRLIEPDVINRTIKGLTTDRKTQEAQAQSARNRLCSDLGADQSFTAFAKRISEIQFRDNLSEASDQAASMAHENLFKQPSDFRRIMGVNIVEKLNEQYGGMTEQLEENIKTLVQSAAAYMTFDTGPHNPQPAVLLRDGQMPSMPRGSITVFLPRCPALDQFRIELQQKFKTSISGGQTVEVVDTDHNPHEITIVSTRHWFALRFMRPLAKLRLQYEAKIRSGEGPAIHQIHIENHRCEVDNVPLGRGVTLLKNLFTLNDESARKKALPILLLAHSLNMLSPMKNPDTGLEGLYFIAERSAAGRALTTPIEAWRQQPHRAC